MARNSNDYKALYNDLLHKYDDIAIRVEQINGLAKALSSMVGYEAKKGMDCTGRNDLRKIGRVKKKGENNMLNIFVNTWGNYNENGADGGEWISLPMSVEELEEKLEAIAQAMGDTDPEFCIHDYEYTGEIELEEISEYTDIQQINELCNEAAALEEYELEEIAAAIDAWGYSFKEAMEKQQNGCFCLYRGVDMLEVAEEIMEECWFTKDTPAIFRDYFDYRAFARGLEMDGYTETKYGVIWEG